MIARMNKQAENDSDKFYKKRNQNHTNLAHTFAVEDQHPEYKLLPVLKGEQRNWYHARFSQKERCDYLKDLYSRFKKNRKSSKRVQENRN